MAAPISNIHININRSTVASREPSAGDG